MRLRTKYALVLLAIMVVLGGVVLGATELFKQRTIQQEQSELSQTANLTADQIAERVETQQRNLAGLANDPSVANVSRSGERLSTFIEATPFFATQVVAPNGTVLDFRGEISAAQREAVVGTSIANRTSFRAAREGNVYTRAPEILTRTDHVVTISVPIAPSIEGETEGVLVGALTVSPATGGQRQRGNSGLLNPIESIIRTDAQAVQVTAPAAEASGRAILNPTNRTFERQLTASATISPGGQSALGPDWSLTVFRDRAALTQRIQTLQTVQAGSLLVVLLSLVGLGVWQYRTNLRQTERLLEGFGALTEGRFDYELSLSSAEEWQQISDGFNELGSGLRERERTIEERRKQLSVVNRVLRHNVQNDLTVVQGYAEMLPTLGEDRLEDAADTIREKVEGLVDHAQKARRIEDALAEAEGGLTEVDVVAPVERSLDSCAEAHPEVTVSRDLPDELRVTAITSLRYGIENVVENAFEHNDGADPHVEVSVERDADEVRVVVTDDGPGIPAHEYEVLEQDEETDLDHGSGIGLWLAYWVVTKSGGDLRFETDDGTVATVALQPAGAEETEPDGEPATPV